MKYGALQYSQGPMAILFRPGDGRTCRVHFNAGDDARVRIMLGEPGEFGPIHPVVAAGHAAVAALRI